MAARRRKSAAETIASAKLADFPKRRITDEQQAALVIALAKAQREVDSGATAFRIGKSAAEIIGILLDAAG